MTHSRADGVKAVLTFLLVLFSGIAVPLWLFPDRSGFQVRVYEDDTGDEFVYQLFVPHDYRPDRKWPVILFLHGSGESGDDGKKQSEAGLGPAIRARAATFPFLAVFPQSAECSWDANQDDAMRALAMLEQVCADYAVDPDRVYLTGFSMGGNGTWELAALLPDKWAAIVPICGYADHDSAARLAHLPCWCFHGARDESVPVEQSRAMIAALKQAGGTPRYSEYPELAHNAWDAAYNDEELYTWLGQQRRDATSKAH